MPWEEHREYVIRSIEAHDRRMESFIQKMEVHCEREDLEIRKVHDRLTALEGSVAVMKTDTQAKFDAQKSEFRILKLYALFGGALTAGVAFLLSLIAHYFGLNIPMK